MNKLKKYSEVYKIADCSVDELIEDSEIPVKKGASVEEFVVYFINRIEQLKKELDKYKNRVKKSKEKEVVKFVYAKEIAEAASKYTEKKNAIPYLPKIVKNE